jgi:Flp pilus assembly protein TadG
MHKSKEAGGQGLVEFALVLPVLLFIVIGVLDIGRAFFVKVVLENSAREGAYYMVYNTDEGKANSFALTKAAVQIEAQNSGVTIAADNIEVVCMVGGAVNNLCPSGSTVTVTVRNELEMVLGFIFDGPLDLVSDARMLIQ